MCNLWCMKYWSLVEWLGVRKWYWRMKEWAQVLQNIKSIMHRRRMSLYGATYVRCLCITTNFITKCQVSLSASRLVVARPHLVCTCLVRLRHTAWTSDARSPAVRNIKELWCCRRNDQNYQLNIQSGWQGIHQPMGFWMMAYRQRFI